jgi:hypothetical protein
MQHLRPTPHRVGKLFEVLAEQGEDMRFRIGLARVGAEDSYDDHRAHHKDVDGYGAVVSLFRAREIEFEAPAGRSEPAPSLRRRASAMVHVMQGGQGDRVRWKTPTAAASAPAHAEAARLLSEAETNRLRAACKREGVSMTALLLRALNATVTPLVADGKGPATWTVPVNMRGGVRVEPDIANASSLVALLIAPGATSRDVDRALREAIEQNLHWGKWDQVNLMIRFGERALRKKVRQYYAGGHASRIGVFSNIGAWKARVASDVGIVGFGPATRMDPIFAGAITLNGKLSLSMRAHPLLGVRSSDVKEWLDAWLRALAVGAGRPIASSDVTHP